MKKRLCTLVTTFLVISAFFMSCGQSPHEHSFATEWSTDAENHWHAATCEHSDQVSEKGAHTFGEWVETTENKTRECSVCGYKEVSENCTHEFGEWVVTKGATEESEGEKARTCSLCDYKETEVIPMLPHKHTFATKWSSDAENHWYAATCKHSTEVKDKAKHTFSGYTEQGIKGRKCSVCEYVDISRVKVPTFEYDAENSTVSITCETENTTIYYTTDETDPTTSSTEYKEPIDFTEGMIIKAFAVCKDMVSSDVATFKFVKISYSTEYDEAPEGKSVIVGTTLTEDDLPTLENENYYFDGWYIDATKVEVGYKVEKDITLTAKWSQPSLNFTIEIQNPNDSDEKLAKQIRVEPRKNGDGSIDYSQYDIYPPTEPSFDNYWWTFMGQTQKYGSSNSYYIGLYSYPKGVYPVKLEIPEAEFTVIIYIEKK